MLVFSFVFLFFNTTLASTMLNIEANTPSFFLTPACVILCNLFYSLYVRALLLFFDQTFTYILE